MKKILFIFLWLPCFFPTPTYAFTLSNFSSPESVLVDPEDASYYVSNVNGGVSNKDGNGYVSRISANGNTVIQKYFGDKKKEMLLHAPKGLAVLGKNIFVADIDCVKGFNKESGKPSVLVDFGKFAPKFLNDLASDAQGFLYVSDTLGNRIYQVNSKKDYEVTILKEGPELEGPNGLMVNPKTKNLVVVTWGSGQILEVDHQGKVHTLKRGLGNLDGVDHDMDGNFYVSSYTKGEVYRIPNFGRGPLSTFLSGLNTPADISVDRTKAELLIPSFDGNTVTTVSLKSKK